MQGVYKYACCTAVVWLVIPVRTRALAPLGCATLKCTLIGLFASIVILLSDLARTTARIVNKLIRIFIISQCFQKCIDSESDY